LDDAIREKVKGLPDGLVHVTTKTETPALKLPDLIAKMCRKWHKS